MAKDDFGHVDSLPEEIRDIFMWLSQEVANLTQKWRFYLDLFGRPESSSVLERASSVGFRIMEESLRIDMTMTICRLADRVNGGRNDNLSFAKLADYYVSDSGLQAAVKRFADACEPVVKSRNKRVGHNDLSTKLRPHESMLPAFGRIEIDLIITSAKEALNYVSQTKADHTLMFDMMETGGERLVHWLRVGLATNERFTAEEG